MVETAARLAILEEVTRLLEKRWGGGALQRLVDCVSKVKQIQVETRTRQA
jgi:hypothetical protein